MARYLAVDPGEKHIGLAISDPTGTIANPYSIINHISRQQDAEAIVKICNKEYISQIIVGQSIDDDGKPTYEGRQSIRLAAAIRSFTDIPVVLWDESDSTKIAHQARICLGTKRSRRKGHIDDLAATVILQSFLDSLAGS